jgi:NAD-dependent SIR2 family protein deacetylase
MGTKYDLGECVDCHQRQRVRHLEWVRAAAPRCRNCGGRLEPSAVAYEEHLQRRMSTAERRTPGGTADQSAEGGDLS